MIVNDINIIANWLSVPNNAEKCKTIVFTKQVFDFVVANADRIDTGGKTFYKVGGEWCYIKYKRDE